MYIVLKREYDNGLVTIGYNKVKEGDAFIASSTKTYTAGETSFRVTHTREEKALMVELGKPIITLLALTESKEIAKLIKRKIK